MPIHRTMCLQAHPRTPAFDWDRVAALVRSKLPARKAVSIKVPDFAHPRLVPGFVRDVGLPVGQISDYRWSLPDGSCVHVQDFGHCITAHWDEVDPTPGIAERIRHCLVDAPVASCLAVIGLLWLSRKRAS